MRLLDTAHEVGEVAGVRRDEVHPVLCLTGDTPEDSWNRGVSVCGIVNLSDTLMFKRERLDRVEVEAAALAVSRSMRKRRTAPRVVAKRIRRSAGLLGEDHRGRSRRDPPGQGSSEFQRARSALPAWATPAR
jgi:hypothetical protein